LEIGHAPDPTTAISRVSRASSPISGQLAISGGDRQVMAGGGDRQVMAGGGDGFLWVEL